MELNDNSLVRQNVYEMRIHRAYGHGRLDGSQHRCNLSMSIQQEKGKEPAEQRSFSNTSLPEPSAIVCSTHTKVQAPNPKDYTNTNFWYEK